MWTELKKLLLPLALVGVGTGIVHAETDLAAAHRLAAEASSAYEDQDFVRAATLYSDAIEKGLDHPILRYDLGNAYYKSGDLGRAILWYERARRDAPRDRAIRHNLEQARSQMQDLEISSHVAPVLLRPVSFVRDLLALDGWSKLVVVTLLLLCGVGCIRQWGPDSRLGSTRLVLGLAALLLVSAAMTASWIHERYGADSMIVVQEEVEVHSGPGEDYDLAFRVHSGLKVEVDERRGEWARIDLGGELVGWIPLDSAESL